MSAMREDIAVLDSRISASLLRLRRASPFFATLAMHAHYRSSADVPTAATDGADVFFNPDFFAALPDAHVDGVLLHEVMHAALAHVERRGRRDAELWNVAADVVVNGLVIGNGFELPDGALRDTMLEGMSVEEVFAVLAGRDDRPPLSPDQADLLEQPTRSGASTPRPEGVLPARASRSRQRSWQRAVERAATAQANGQRELPAGVVRAFGLDSAASADWRSVLWRFLSASRSDFATFDRRFAYQGIYLETLENESLDVHVCIDTSGSIDEVALAAFMGELDAVLHAYPTVACQLWFADAEAHGPYPLVAGGAVPPPIGGGGTDFRPFFDAVATHADPSSAVLVYLTDGYGTFPDEAPEAPVLWAVTAGGVDASAVPFGEVVRLAHG